MTKAKNTEKSRSVFKIKTEDVRRAAKKAGLEIDSGSYFVHAIDGSIVCGCPLGCLYAKNHKLHDEFNLDDQNNAYKWSIKSFGQYYVSGFTDAFDGYASQKENYSYNKKKYNQYINGFRNGQLLRRTLLKK